MTLTPAVLNGRILIVDDDPASRFFLQKVLLKHGFCDIRVAVDGRDALMQIEAEAPDLVILDIVMPQLDGFGVCAQLRSKPRFANLPILFQTAFDGAQDRAKAFAQGASDLVSKPINVAELIARIAIHLDRRALIADLTYYRERTREELAIAREMQLGLLPSPEMLATIAQRYRVDVAGHFAPCSEIGGDLWGIGAIDAKHFAVYAIDFSGHGVGAALNTFRVTALIEDFWELAGDPGAFLAALNRRLCHMVSPGQFATMFHAVADTDGRLIYGAAGAPPPLLIDADGAGASWLDSTGLPLGLMEDAVYPQRRVLLPPGATLFLASDAILDVAAKSDSLFHPTAFLAAATAHAAAGAAAAVAAIAQNYAAQQPGGAQDDVTLVCLQRQTA